MIKLENTDVYGFEAAVRGLRNPMNSWDKSDSAHDFHCEECVVFARCFKVGENDLALMRKLAHAGDDYGKFARFINVSVDITAPLYWWKEFDTCKVGTVSNSCSTMHKVHAKKFELDDFSHEHLSCIDLGGGYKSPYQYIKDIVRALNVCRELYLDTKDKEYWWQMIQLLPSSYNQRRTVQFNYQVLNRIYRARKNHKLDEWHEFCAWVEKLPYFADIYLEGVNGGDDGGIRVMVDADGKPLVMEVEE